MDFETASEAGFVWNDALQKWEGPPGSPQNKKGLKVVGAAVYAEHPTTRVLTLSFKLPGDATVTRWRPGQPLPQRLFDWIAAGGRVRAHNVMFERLIWTLVCVPLYGFPPLRPECLDCTMATARVNALPGGLGELGDVLELSVRKNADGRRVLNKFSIPRKPTKGDPRFWIKPEDDPADAEILYSYCDDDVLAEEAAGEAMPGMTPDEREFWLIDQEINWRGLGVDRKGVRDCIAVLNQALARYGDECRQLTGGLDPTQLEKLKGWLAAHHVYVNSLDAEAVESILSRIAPHPPGKIWPPRRVIELRALIGSASVKKLFAMENMASADDRLRNLIVHHGARTGRPTGEGAQPLNMPRSGPKLVTCAAEACGRPYAPDHNACPWCGSPAVSGAHKAWKAEMVDHVLEIMAYRSLELAEFFFGDALLTISGCLRGLFVAAEGHDLIASDYSAIEAVVTAELADEDWRREAFQAKRDIYLVSASKITGKSYEWYMEYFAEHGEHHEDRQKIGKVAELALGFGGWINAWLNFDDTGNFDEPQIKQLILAWRDASPAIVELWGGQWRGLPWDTENGFVELYGLEGAAIECLQNPNTKITPRMRTALGTWRTLDGITFEYDLARDRMLITLLSGRQLTYWEPRLAPSHRDYAAPGEQSITYMTWNSNPKYGLMGWVRMSTFGGRLTENIVQATAHCILRHAIKGLRLAGFPTVLHVYDEIVGEIPAMPPMPKGVPDPWIARFEAIMADLPWWCRGWPVRASGGWRGRRYRKG